MPLASRSQQIVGKLRGRKSLPSLAPESVWLSALDEEIAALPEFELAGSLPDCRMTVQAWKAALHLWNDSLERAHALVQDLNTPAASALHGILHRREGDYDNAKYWFRRTGDFPAFEVLHVRAAEWLAETRSAWAGLTGNAAQAIRMIASQGIWNPYLFVDAAAMTAGKPGMDKERDILERLQHMELEAVMRYLESRMPGDEGQE